MRFAKKKKIKLNKSTKMETKRKLLVVKQPFTEVHSSNLKLIYTYPKQVTNIFKGKLVHIFILLEG